jgi:hypothetical protein
MLPKTIKEIVNVFKSWADLHLQVERFEYGEFSTISISKDYDYPLVFVEQSNIGQTTASFNIYFLALWDKGVDTTLLDAFNETSNIMHDFTSYIEKTLEIADFQLAPPFKSNDDVAIGWQLNITINYFNITDCNG